MSYMTNKSGNICYFISTLILQVYSLIFTPQDLRFIYCWLLEGYSQIRNTAQFDVWHYTLKVSKNDYILNGT
jgi:hypothetical protein